MTDGPDTREQLLAIQRHLTDGDVSKGDLHSAIYAMVALETALCGRERFRKQMREVSGAILKLSGVLETLDSQAVAQSTERWLKDPVKVKDKQR